MRQLFLADASGYFGRKLDVSNAKTVRIANGAGFLGDQLSAPRRLVEGAAVDYLTLEYLAELTMSILARQREKDPQAGFAEDFLIVLRDLLPAVKSQPQLKIVTNGGGMNPIACARAAAEILQAAGLGETSIGVVTGDDLLPRMAELRTAGCEFRNLDTDRPIAELTAPVVSANAYLGARPIAAALAQGARIVITGRVADASLTLGPAVYEFGWDWNDLPRIAGGTVAGHLIECGSQVTGGYATEWRSIDYANLGYPIAELSADGSCVITKPAGTSGAVNRRTVTEQLVYEIGDPACYHTPDIALDFTTVEVEDLGADRVRVFGATGRAASDTYKVSLAYRDGYFASGQLLVYGADCVAKAHCVAETILARTAAATHKPERSQVEFLGLGHSAPINRELKTDSREVVLRVTVHDPRREVVEQFTREIAPLITSGPAGLAGYASGRPSVRPVFAYWPTLVPKKLVPDHVEVRTATEWRE